MDGARKEQALVKEPVDMARTEQLRIPNAVKVIYILVHDAETHHRHGRIEHVVETNKDRVVHRLREASKPGEGVTRVGTQRGGGDTEGRHEEEEYRGVGGRIGGGGGGGGV